MCVFYSPATHKPGRQIEKRRGDIESYCNQFVALLLFFLSLEKPTDVERMRAISAHTQLQRRQ